MSHTITIEEAASRLADLISALHPGDEITLTSENKPVAKIIPQPAPPKRQFGAGKGLLIVHQEDDEHLKDFEEYMR